MEEGSAEENFQQTPHKKSKTIIKIPSYQEVFDSSQPKSQSFSQAFAFLKSSEFYSPPPKPPSPSSSQSLPASNITNPRKNDQLDTSSSSTSASTATPVNSLSVSSSVSRNAILVSNRQEDVVKPLLEVTKTALLHDCTLLCAWSLEECGRYLETIKVYENKPADLIQGQMDTDYLSRLTHVLTSVRHVNKTDVVTLGTTFGSLSHIMDASMEDLARCPGIGERKVRRLYDTFHEPFKRIVSTHPAVPETPTQNSTKPRSINEEQDVDGKRIEEDGSQHKREPKLNVKSALSAAFAKYADKIAKSSSMPQEKEIGEPESSNVQ